jgi:DNA-binding NtrC family response regulator
VTGFSALVVDDDPGFRESLSLLVAREGYEVRQAESLDEARRRLAEAPVDVVLVDLGLPDGDGIELLRDEPTAASSEIVLLTGNASVESAVQALREGALDYLTKPVDRSRLKSILAGVTRTHEFKAEVRSLRGELRELGRFGPMVGRSPAMQRVYDLIARVAPTRLGVLLIGESGTGKELAAETIHRLSRRRQAPFLAVNCAAVAKTLIESELFGHEKGSFTGADAGRRGYFEEAHGGTLFLDEVGAMSPELQGRLLRVLETGTLLRVGGSEIVPVDVRVIAATNRDPVRAVREGALREDLYYRLNVFPIVVPPLRERGDDVELLADHFLGAVNAREQTRKHWTPEARLGLQARPWPGNVRELKNAVERAAILADVAIGPELLPTAGIRGSGGSPAPERMLQVRVGSTLEEAERRLILATLAELKGDKRQTAQTLGIGLKTLYTRLGVYRAAGQLVDSEGAPGMAARPSDEATGDGRFVESALPERP